MINITLKDGSVKKYSKETSVISIAKDISEGLARNVISANFNDKVVEINSMINEDGKLEFYTWDNDEGKKAFWHSSSHVMAQSIQELFPGVKLTIGPAINRTATKYLVKMAKKNEKEHGGMDKSMMWHLPKRCTNACH